MQNETATCERSAIGANTRVEQDHYALAAKVAALHVAQLMIVEGGEQFPLEGGEGIIEGEGPLRRPQLAPTSTATVSVHWLPPRTAHMGS